MPLFQRKSKTKEKGDKGELLAEKYLKKQGLKPIKRNYRCKMGEIDLIMSDGNDIVFVEVRIRSNKNYASGAESVTLSKQRKIIKTANLYLQNNPEKYNNGSRFDVISISLESNLEKNLERNLERNGISGDKNPIIDWIANAFEVTY